MQGIVYQITNVTNGTRYIGQTTKTLKQRWAEHVYDATGAGSRSRGSYLHSAILKYGENSFSQEVLNTCLSKEALDIVEKFYISLFNTVRPNGYNICLGGTGVMHGRKMSEESKAKISAKSKGHPGYIFTHTQEAKDAISKSLLGNTRSVGRKHSAETKEKMRLAHLGRKYKKKTVV